MTNSEVPEKPKWLKDWVGQAERSGTILKVEFDTQWVVEFGKPGRRGAAFPAPPSEHAREIRLVFTADWSLKSDDWPEGLTFELARPEGAVTFTDRPPVNANFVGPYGTFNIPDNAPLENPQFGSSNESAPQFSLETDRKRIHDGAGFVKLKLGKTTAGVFRGHPVSGVSLVGLSGLKEGAVAGEIESVDIFGLPYTDLETLSRIRRLRPFWPRKGHGNSSRIDRKTAATRALAMKMGTDDDILKETRRTEFWERFTDGLRTQHPGGENLAVAREVTYEVRKAATGPTEVEWWLLSIASIFKYGTRIARPFVVWLIAALLGALGISWLTAGRIMIPDLDQYFPIALDLFISPITFIRASESSTLTALIDQGAWERFVVVIVRLVGAASIAFAFVAVRTYTRFRL